MTSDERRSTAMGLFTLIGFIRAWLLDAHEVCTREYGRVVRIHDIGANITRCGRHGCAHDEGRGYPGLAPCDRFDTGPWIEFVYACDCRYVGGSTVDVSDTDWSADDDVNRHGGHWHEHHAVYGAIGEARATCWAS